MTQEPVSANRLLVVLCAYFVVLLGVVLSAGVAYPDLLPFLPVGGNDVLDIADSESAEESIFDGLGPSKQVAEPPLTADEVGLIALFLGFSLGGTVLVMLPVAWTYAAIKRETGYRKSFVRALIVLPIIAAICVGLAAGIGHLGVAAVMALFFCVANTVLWKMDYGKNPIDDLRLAHKRAKLEGSARSRNTP